MISSTGSTVCGTIGTVCWCVQLIPQIVYNFKRKDCEGFPPSMMLLWLISGIPSGMFFIITRDTLILQIQPHLFMLFCAVSFIQSLYYPPVKLARWKIVATMVFFVVAGGLLEFGFIYWLRPLHDRGITWPSLVIGIIAAVVLACGLVPPYFELAKRRGRVVGINFIFLTVDFMGAFFNILSVALGTMNVVGMVQYAVVGALEVGIFLSQLIWLVRFRWIRKEVTTDEEDVVLDKEKVDDRSTDHDGFMFMDHSEIQDAVRPSEDKPS